MNELSNASGLLFHRTLPIKVTAFVKISSSIPLKVINQWILWLYNLWNMKPSASANNLMKKLLLHFQIIFMEI